METLKRIFYAPSDYFTTNVWNYLVANPLTANDNEILASEYGLEEFFRQRSLGQDPVDATVTLKTSIRELARKIEEARRRLVATGADDESIRSQLTFQYDDAISALTEFDDENPMNN